jgi:hypothetical protein
MASNTILTKASARSAQVLAGTLQRPWSEVAA